MPVNGKQQSFQELNFRPCEVTLRKNECKRGWFHRWIDCASVLDPGIAIGSHSGGQLRDTYAIVELEDGTIILPEPNRVKFLDGATHPEPRISRVADHEVDE